MRWNYLASFGLAVWVEADVMYTVCIAYNEKRI